MRIYFKAPSKSLPINSSTCRKQAVLCSMTLCQHQQQLIANHIHYQRHNSILILVLKKLILWQKNRDEHTFHCQHLHGTWCRRITRRFLQCRGQRLQHTALNNNQSTNKSKLFRKTAIEKHTSKTAVDAAFGPAKRRAAASKARADSTASLCLANWHNVDYNKQFIKSFY